MRQYKEEKTKVIDQIICNKCGKIIDDSDALSVEKRWGYFSEKDNEVHQFDLCEQCYDEMIASFQIPITIE